MGAGNRLVDDGRYQYYYDNEGNLVRRYDTLELRDLRLDYDNRNRLVSITEVVDDVQTFDLLYDYDTFNRRVGRMQMTIVQGSEGHPTTVDYDYEKYVYDGDHVVLDFYQGYAGGYTLDHRYLYGPGTDQLLAQENLLLLGLTTSVTDPGRVFWPLTDNLGTVRDLVGTDGSLIEHYRYDAFGNIVEGNSAFTRYLYTGREFDESTGLQYNRNRWYDSVSGRWLSEDPLGFAAGDANLYRYVGNSPTNFRDPSGLVYSPGGPGTGAGTTGGAYTNGAASGGAVGATGSDVLPPLRWLYDQAYDYANLKAWNALAPLRVHGGEGANVLQVPYGAGGASPPPWSAPPTTRPKFTYAAMPEWTSWLLPGPRGPQFRSPSISPKIQGQMAPRGWEQPALVVGRWNRQS